MNSFFVFRSSSIQTRATHRTINAVHSWVADKGLNLKHFPTRGIFGLFMDKVFLHFHLQFVSLYTSSDLWLSSLRSQFADFLWICTRAQQGREVITRWTSCKKFRLLQILHSSEFCSVIFKAEVPHRSVGSCSCQIQFETFTKSNLVPIDANFDGLSTAVVSHAFSSFESMHNSMISSSLRFSTMQSGLSDSSIFSSISVLFGAKAVHLFGCCICCICCTGCVFCSP